MCSRQRGLGGVVIEDGLTTPPEATTPPGSGASGSRYPYSNELTDSRDQPGTIFRIARSGKMIFVTSVDRLSRGV